MGLLQGEAGAVLRDCWHSQRSPGDPHSLLWWQGGFRVMDSLEGPGAGGTLIEADTVFKAFANSFEKSSSHWQARDEYLSDVKQDKNQTMAELDIYIKDLIRRCQFPPEDQESRKIDLLYHATAHFEVRKFVHNAKHEELKYDRMIEVVKAHERTCQEYQIHKQAHSMANPSNSYANPLIQTNALSKSFQKGPPRKTCGKCGRSHSHSDCPAYRTTCSKCGRPNHWAQQCRSSGRRNSSTGRSPSPGRPQNRQRCTSGNKQPNKGKGWGRGAIVKQRSTPKRPGSGHGRGGGKPFKMNALTVTGLPGSQHPPKVDGTGKDGNKGVRKYECWSFKTSTPSQSFRWAILQYFRMWCLNKQW